MVTYGAMSQQVGNMSAWLQHIPLVRPPLGAPPGLLACHQQHLASVSRPMPLSATLSTCPVPQPLTVPPGLLIFNDIRLRGFWLTGGYAKASPPPRLACHAVLCLPRRACPAV